MAKTPTKFEQRATLDGSVWRLAFDSVDDAVAFAADPDVMRQSKTPRLMADHRTEIRDRGPRWTGMPYGFTWDQLLTMVREGWADGASRLEQLNIDVPTARNIRRRVTWGPAGDMVDMQRVYGGQLERAWSAARRRKVPAFMTKTIVVDVGANCGTNAEVLFWRGAAALVLADLLTKAGYNTEILAVTATNGTYKDVGRASCTTIRVKSALAPLEINSLASVVCCAAFFRGVLFNIKASNSVDKACPSLGYHTTPEDLGAVPEGAVSGTSTIRDAASAKAWVLACLAAMGVEFETGAA